MSIIFTVRDKEYKLRLPASAVITLEKMLGNRSPVSIVKDVIKGIEPRAEDVLLCLYQALQAHHDGLTLKETYTLYDDYVSEGGDINALLLTLIDVFKESGLMTRDIEKN